MSLLLTVRFDKFIEAPAQLCIDLDVFCEPPVDRNTQLFKCFTVVWVSIGTRLATATPNHFLGANGLANLVHFSGVLIYRIGAGLNDGAAEFIDRLYELMNDRLGSARTLGMRGQFCRERLKPLHLGGRSGSYFVEVFGQCSLGLPHPLG